MKILIVLVTFSMISLISTGAILCRTEQINSVVTTLSLSTKTKDNCVDKQVCYSRCSSVFQDSKCPDYEVGIEMKDNNLYKQACAIRDRNDALISYLDKVQFRNRDIKTDNKDMYNMFIQYIAEIRRFDWCTAEGTKEYERRQNQYLNQFDESGEMEKQAKFRYSDAGKKQFKREQKRLEKDNKSSGKPATSAKPATKPAQKPAQKPTQQRKTTTLSINEQNKKAKEEEKKKQQKLLKAQQISAKLLDKLPVKGKPSLFIFQLKAILLKKFRDQQLENRKCQCKNVVGYLSKNSDGDKQKADFMNAMKTFCQSRCDTSKTKPLNSNGRSGRNGRTRNSRDRRGRRTRNGRSRGSSNNSNNENNESSSESHQSGENGSQNNNKESSERNNSNSEDNQSSNEENDTIDRSSKSSRRSSTRGGKKSSQKISNNNGITIIINNNNDN